MKEISNLVIQDSIIHLTGVLGTVYTPQNGAFAPLKGARKRILVAGVSEVSIISVCAGSLATTRGIAASGPICRIVVVVEHTSNAPAVGGIACIVAGGE